MIQFKKRALIIAGLMLLMTFMSTGGVSKSLRFMSESTNTSIDHQCAILINQTFGGPAVDYAYSVIATSDGGYALAGHTASYSTGDSDMWLVKTTATGQVEWNQTFGGAGEEAAYSVIATSDGGYVLAGHTSSYGAGDMDMWLVKASATGQAEWNRTFGGPAQDIAFSAIATSNGGYALAGRTESFGAGESDMWLVKTTATGQAEWNRTFGGVGGDGANSIIATSDGGYALAGNTVSYGAGDMDMWLVKTTATGQAEWNQTFGGSAQDIANSVITTPDGGYVLAGLTASHGVGGRDMWLVKTTATGQAEWNQTFGGTAADYADSVIATSDGGYVLVGRTDSFGAGENDMWLVKTTAAGQAEFNQTFGEPGEEAAYSVIATSDGGYVLVGRTESFGAGSHDIWLIKIALQDITATTTELPTTDTTQSRGSSGFGLIPLFITLLAVIICYRQKK